MQKLLLIFSFDEAAESILERLIWCI